VSWAVQVDFWEVEIVVATLPSIDSFYQSPKVGVNKLGIFSHHALALGRKLAFASPVSRIKYPGASLVLHIYCGEIFPAHMQPVPP
jgi:hypothetical protein